MRTRFGVILVLLGTLLALGGPAAALPFVVTDKAFIDNRQPNDPLATGLFLNLGVGFTDSPVTNPTATGTSSNVAFPFGPIPMALDFPLSPGGAGFGASFNLVPAQFSSITGTYTFHLCDTNGCVNDTTHNLDHPEVLLFPTNLAFSNQTTTPLFTMTDPNGAAGAGLIRGYQMRIYEVIGVNLSEIYDSNPQLLASFQVPGGVLQVGHVYNVRASIDDFDAAEVAIDIANNDFTHDPHEARSTTWAFNFTPRTVSAVPEPGTILLLGTGLVGFRRTVTRKLRNRTSN